MTENAHPQNPPGSPSEQHGEPDKERVVIRDNRKVDRSSGVARGVTPAADREHPDGDGQPAPADGDAADGGATGAGVVDGEIVDDTAADGETRGEATGSDAPAADDVVTGEIVDDTPRGAGSDARDRDRDAGDDRTGGPTGDRTGSETGGRPGAPGDAQRAASEISDLRERIEALRDELRERTADLQRVTAEYANYRKRVDRDRTLVAEQATGTVLTALLAVLDDLDRAREHGDLVGPFGSVADQLVTALTKFGLTAFGSKGDPFDPNRHEAVAHLTSPDVTEPTCVDVMRRGYLLGERLLRAAMVAVADPE